MQLQDRKDNQSFLPMFTPLHMLWNLKYNSRAMTPNKAITQLLANKGAYL